MVCFRLDANHFLYALIKIYLALTSRLTYNGWNNPTNLTDPTGFVAADENGGSAVFADGKKKEKEEPQYACFNRSGHLVHCHTGQLINNESNEKKECKGKDDTGGCGASSQTSIQGTVVWTRATSGGETEGWFTRLLRHTIMPHVSSDEHGFSFGFGDSNLRPSDGVTKDNAIAVGEMGLMVLTAGESKAFTPGRATISSKALQLSPCKCFVAGTVIHTKNGLVPIEKIQVGDWVAARSDETSETKYQQVVRLVRNGEKEIIRLRYRLPNGKTEVLGVTEEHPFMLEGRHWVNAGTLKSGDKIMRLAGGVLTVVSMRHQVIKQHTYNFEVEGFHSYFAGIGGAWVHNSGGPCPWIAKSLYSDLSKRLPRAVMEKFESALSKFTSGQGGQGIKSLGNGLRVDGQIYQYELKILGNSGGSRLYGNLNNEGQIIFTKFKDGH